MSTVRASQTTRWLFPAGLALVLALAGWLRAGTLLDDRTWDDEDYVIQGAFGLHGPWPGDFYHVEVFRPSLSGTFRSLSRHDNYPPLLYLTIYLSGLAPNPIFAARVVIWLANLLLIALVFLTLRAQVGAKSALLIAAYVALSPAMTVSSQLIAWSGLAPPLATLAGLSLLRALERPTLGRWAAYGLALFLALNTHYFCYWILPAHALLALTYAPESRRRYLIASAIVGLLCSPWLALGLSNQAFYYQGFLDDLPAPRADSNWYQPVTLLNLVSWHWFATLTSLGLQPSPLRARYLIPVAPLLLCALWSGWRSGESSMRRLVLVGVGPLLVAFVAQTAYAVRVGSTVALNWHFYSPWMPLFMAAVLLGLLKVRQPFGTVLAALLLLCTGLNVVRDHFPVKITEARSLSRYAEAAALLDREGGAGACIAYRSYRDAKMMNLFYTGQTRQTVWDGSRPLCAGADRVLFVAHRATDPPSAPGWRSAQTLATLGETRVHLLERATGGTP